MKETQQDLNPSFEFPAVLFDLDGTLVDSNYQHVNAWSEALRSAGIVIPTWKIHRRIGMSGKSFLPKLLREFHPRRKKMGIERLEKRHDEIFRRQIPHLVPLPGAVKLLKHLSRHRVRIAIATTSGREQTARLLRQIEIPVANGIVNGDDVEKAKPSPDIFMVAARRLNTPLNNCMWWGTVSGTCSRPAAKARWGLACYPAVMVGRNSNRPGHFACIPTQGTCLCTLSN